eukprot:Clim_evm41s202 gene=Clim_evmTU41s202
MRPVMVGANSYRQTDRGSFRPSSAYFPAQSTSSRYGDFYQYSRPKNTQSTTLQRPTPHTDHLYRSSPYAYHTQPESQAQTARLDSRSPQPYAGYVPAHDVTSYQSPQNGDPLPEFRPPGSASASYRSQRQRADHLGAAYTDRQALESQRKEWLEGRRMELARLLAREETALSHELATVHRSKVSGAALLADLRSRTSTLRRQREQQRAHNAYIGMKQAMVRNAPELKAAEARVLRDRQTQNLAAQKHEHEAAAVELVLEKDAAAKRLAIAHELLVAEETERERKERAEKAAYAGELQTQLETLRLANNEARALAQEQEKLERERMEFAEVEFKRQQSTRRQRERHEAQILERQTRAAMLQRAESVRKAIEEDSAMLRQLMKADVQGADVVQEDAARRKAEMEEYLDYLDRVKEHEQQREQAVEAMLQREAERVWAERAAEWEKEEAARQRLMVEVVEGWKVQLQERLDRIRGEREQNLAERDRLLQALEWIQRQNSAEAEAKERKRRAQLEALNEQVSERERLGLRRAEEERATLEFRALRESEYGQMLAEEARRMEREGLTRKEYAGKYYRTAQAAEEY